MIDEAERYLHSAAAFKHMGRYQLEAAIQSIHASRARIGHIDWREIALLYEGLVRIAPGIGSLVGRALRLPKRTGRLRDLRRLNRFQRSKRQITSPIGPRADICFAC